MITKIVAVVVFIILALVLVFLVKAFIPAISETIRRLPNWGFIFLFVIILGVMAFLISYVITDKPGGNQGDDGAEVEESQASDEDVAVTDIIEDCIVLSQNEIYVENQVVDQVALEKYIDDHVVNNVPITIVDNYSTATVHHMVTDLCDKKGVNYSEEDETWIWEQ